MTASKYVVVEREALKEAILELKRFVLIAVEDGFNGSAAHTNKLIKLLESVLNAPKQIIDAEWLEGLFKYGAKVGKLREAYIRDSEGALLVISDAVQITFPESKVEIVGVDREIRCPECGGKTFADSHCPASDYPELKVYFRVCESCDWRSDDQTAPEKDESGVNP